MTKCIKGAIIRIVIYLMLIAVSGALCYHNFTRLSILLSFFFNFVCITLAMENADVLSRKMKWND